MGIIKLITILIALVVVLSMVLRHLSQNKTKEMCGKLADNALEKKKIKAQKQVMLGGVKTQQKALSVQQDMARNPYKADIARARGEAISSSISSVTDSELAKPIGQAVGNTVEALTGAYEVRALTDMTTSGTALLTGKKEQLPGPTGPKSITFLDDEEL